MAYLTEQELLNRYAFYATQIEVQLRTGRDTAALINDIPVPVHINDAQTLRLLHTNKSHARRTRYAFQEIDEIQEQGVNFLHVCTHPATLAAIPVVTAHHQQTKDATQVLQLIQHVRPKNANNYLPVITFAKHALYEQAPIVCLSPFASDFGKMSDKLARIVEMDQFKLRNFARFQQLTAREIDVMRLLCHGYNNRGIAEFLGLSRQTIETHRKRLKAKLELTSFRDLLRYALAFEVITLD